jgi:hypothetical protein
MLEIICEPSGRAGLITSKLYAEKLVAAKLAKLREVDERRFAPPERRP